MIIEQKTDQKNERLGIIAGISTGIFWGIPFLVPQISRHFSSLEIAFGRFFFFGLISLIFLKPVIAIIRSLSLGDRFFLLALSASGFWFYSMVLFWAIQRTGGVVSSLVIGLLPITIPLFSPNRQTGGVRFYAGLALLAAGLLNLFLWPIIESEKQLQPVPHEGIAALLVSLGLWTWFAISNTRFLHRNPQINRKNFASVMGVVSLISILPFFLASVNPAELVQREGFSIFLIGVIALGVGSSWIANWLWNICSFHCRSEISGPLIVSETIFGLIYSFGFENRWPRGHESLSILLFMLGVYFAVTSKVKQNQ